MTVNNMQMLDSKPQDQQQGQPQQGYQQPQQQQQPQQGQHNPPNYGQQASPQNNVDDPNRHNGDGAMNRPAQHQQGQQQVQYAEDGSVIPF